MVLSRVAISAGLALGGCVPGASAVVLSCVPPPAADIAALALTDELCAAVGAEMTRRIGSGVTVLPVGQPPAPAASAITLYLLEIAPRQLRARLEWPDRTGAVKGPVLTYSVEDIDALPPTAVADFARGLVQVYTDMAQPKPEY